MPSAVILPVQQRTDAWLEARFDGIGASEAAAAIGVSQWQSRVGLWAHKLRLVPSPEPTMAMRLGIELEPFIARLYSESTGVKVRRANQLRRHPEHTFMLASLDRRAGRKPIELKFSERGTGYGEPGTDEVPDEVLVQVLHQLAVVDEPEGEVALLRPSRQTVDIYVIRREDAAEAAIVEQEAIFWDHVRSRTEPPIDGSEATARALSAIYPRDSGEVLEADAELRDALTRLRAVRRNEKQIAGVRDELENRIKAAMATAAVVRAPGIGEISWRATKDVESIDWKSIAGELDRLVDYANEHLGGNAEATPLLVTGLALWRTGGLHSIHTTTKPGVRRFVPKWEEE